MYSQDEFEQLYCFNCGSQRCEGIDTEWFIACQHKDKLKKPEPKFKKTDRLK